MNYIIQDEKILLHYVPGKGSWTYHIVVPNTKDIPGKRGEIKVSGSIDGYPLVSRQLAPLKGQDKMLSINKTIRDAIGKTGGDMVSVSLYLLPNPTLYHRQIKNHTIQLSD